MNEINPCLLLPLCVLYGIQNQFFLHSGHRPDHIHNHAVYYRDICLIKDNLAEEIPRDDELEAIVAPCHSFDDLHYSGSPKWGYIFFYGGPGGDCVGT